MGIIFDDKVSLLWRGNKQELKIEAWGEDSFRVRTGFNQVKDGFPGALEAVSNNGDLTIHHYDDYSEIINGDIKATVNKGGLIHFYRVSDGKLLVKEVAYLGVDLPGLHRVLRPAPGGLVTLNQYFSTDDEEKIFGLGQHMNGCFDQKGLVLDLSQENSAVSIPFYYSTKGYAFLWNNPGVGRVELARDRIRWVADACHQGDYWISACKEPAVAMKRYFEVTGIPPAFPDWASGFWQCRLRYTSQEQVLNVARRYHEMGVPLSVIVIDYFAWNTQGDWRFDNKCFPDPTAMVKELNGMGVKVMVSIWPSTHPGSENYKEMRDRGMLLEKVSGLPIGMTFEENNMRDGKPMPVFVTYYDATNPEARQFVWDKAKQHYYDHGIEIFWLDANEPECYPNDKSDIVFHQGMGSAVANLYPREHEKAFYDGMRAAGQEQVLNLCRSAWAGSQKYGAAVWSGDVPSTFQALKNHIPAGLNMIMSGIPWWSHDIGGFHSGNIDDPKFRELMVRWFQFGAFSPIFRLHGFRLSNSMVSHGVTGGAENEIWSFGEQAQTILTDYIQLREKFRPYIHQHMELTATTGKPLMRPLFMDFPQDETTYESALSYMFGPDYLVSPVSDYQAREWSVYLPQGTTWRNAWTEEVFEGGQTVQVAAPLEQVPLFVKGDAPNLLNS
ncbi:glycoside hydrolase family 31 protein [Vibrio rhodolitus]|uniref:glycoside hydrolase family 31 protein n=1 Tax=Vibrio rhodolitus TaxID=2231649 RepID=UPI000E0BA735|nr:TIM-barrel domain-containing protein [Vibrio rhodolitus]